MSDPNFKKPREEWVVILLIVVALWVPLYITLETVESERPRVAVQEKSIFRSVHIPEKQEEQVQPGNPSPYGYTASLGIWLFPSFLLWWHLRRFLEPSRRKLLFKSVLLTTGVLGCLGLLLDICFGILFFTFPNRDSILGICLPAFTWGLTDEVISWDLVPIEEFGFYFFGSFAIIMMYVWTNEYWLSAYKVCDDESRRGELVRRFRWSMLYWRSLWIGLGIVIFGFIYRNFFSSAEPGIPGYLIFLTTIGIFPSLLLYHFVKRLINFRAMSITLLMTLLISIFYEVVLGVPYQWWGFREDQMLGVPIAGFSGVPVEEPILWIAIVWASVIFFEMAHTILYVGFQDSGRAVVTAFQQKKVTPAPEKEPGEPTD